jgi:predicted SAM-dependent methyltransferase
MIDELLERIQAYRRRRKVERRRATARKRVAAYPRPLRLHVGCGQNHFPGWVHLDINSALAHVDALWNAEDPLPCEEESVDFIYSEHFLEHLSVEEGVGFLRDCYRVLRPGGVLRTAMPSLTESVRQYYENDWANKPWMEKYGYTWIKTRAEMINIAFRHWGHQWLYDEEELLRRLQEAGFKNLELVAWGKSKRAELQGRETRPETLVICEAVK